MNRVLHDFIKSLQWKCFCFSLVSSVCKVAHRGEDDEHSDITGAKNKAFIIYQETTTEEGDSFL